MTTPQIAKPKPIVDIRLDSISGYIGQGLGPLLSPKAFRIAKLFALKLSEEHGFSIGREDHLYISYSTDLQPGEIRVQANKTKTFYRTVHVGFAQSQFQASGGNEVEFTINTIANVLAKLVGTDSEAKASADIVKVELLQNGEESIVRMLSLYTEGKGFRIELISNCPQTFLCF